MVFIFGVALLSSCDNDDDIKNISDAKMLDEGELFSVCTLNVDGLQIGNSDGPKKELTPVIGKWLADSSFSFIGVQEDFDYDAELTAPLTENYNYDIWGGGVLNNTKVIFENDGLFGKARFNTDGVKSFWKKELIATRTDSMSWNDNYGYFAHAWDENVVKGFRCYNVTTSEGRQVVIYNMHMDAGDEDEELKGKDEEDRRVRMCQWRQLRDYIMDHLDNRPIIILGDLNTYYVRDSVKTQFIDFINDSGRATVADAWIQKARDSQYPPMGDTRIQADNIYSGWTVNGEAPDKILYINPVDCTYKLQLVSVKFHNDNSYFRSNGVTPLGDHFPLSAVFRLKSTK